MRETTFIALLRGVNVGGHNRVPMAELRAACETIGLREARTYIQSGNLIVRAASTPIHLEDDLERLIEEEFGAHISVIVRASAAWSATLRRNPFPDASRAEPNRVMLALSKAPPAKNAARTLADRAAGGELVKRAGDDLWIYFPDGMGKSKLSPALIDRLVGSPVTTRNWRTALELENLAKTPTGD